MGMDSSEVIRRGQQAQQWIAVIAIILVIVFRRLRQDRTGAPPRSRHSFGSNWHRFAACVVASIAANAIGQSLKSVGNWQAFDPAVFAGGTFFYFVLCWLASIPKKAKKP
jgi:hypothetical protein